MENTQNNGDKTKKADETTQADSLEKESKHKKRGKKFLKIAGLVILAGVIYLVLFINGKPTIDTDYLAELNKLNKPENYKEEDNAWPHYQKAFELFKYPREAGDSNEIIFSMTPNKISDFNEPEQKLVLNWIELNQAAWQELVKATQKPYCYIEYKLRNKDKDTERYQSLDTPTFNIDLGYRSTLHIMAFLGQKRIEAEIAQRNIKQAIEDCFALISVCPQWKDKKFYDDQIYAYQYGRFGYEGLIKIFSKTEYQVHQLQEMQERLTNLYRSNSTTFDFNSDKIIFLDMVQHTFTKGGLGGGHLIPKYIKPLVYSGSAAESKLTFQQYILYLLFPKYMGSWLEGEYGRNVYINRKVMNRYFRNQVLCLPISLIHSRSNETIAKYNQVFEQIQAIQIMTPFQIKQTKTSIELERPNFLDGEIHLDPFTKISRYFLIGMLTPWVDDNLSRHIFENKAMYEAIITILALKRYKLENGDYPETLDELLSKGYIATIPMDPFSDKPLVYKKTGTDFTMYSFGEDFKDDGGTRSTNNSRNIVTWGKRSTDKQGCDAVFWPVSQQ
jgi:hypothetical protein